MSKFSASDAAFSGFTLVREHPRAVMVWAVLLTVTSALSTFLTIYFHGPQLEAFASVMRDKSADPEAAIAAFGALTPMLLWNTPFDVAVRGVILAAISRAILTPHDSRNGYLRFGADELRQMGVIVIVNLLMFGLIMSSTILSSLFMVAGGLASLLGLAAFVGGGCLMIYLVVRLSLASPMTFDNRQVMVRRSLPLTKGLFAPLVGTYVLAFIMALIVWLLTMVIVAAVSLIVSGDFANAGSVFQSDATSLETFFTPRGLVQTLFSGVIATLVSLILCSPAPTIYRILKAQGATAPPAGESV